MGIGPAALTNDFPRDEDLIAFIKKAVLEGLRNSVDNGSIYLEDSEVIEGTDGHASIEPMSVPSVHVHFIFDREYRKLFIEFKLSREMYLIVNRNIGRAVRMISKYLKSNLYDTYRVISEILYFEDDDTKSTNTNLLITPYTVGFWKSCDGRYRAIQDKTRVRHDIQNFGLKPHTPSKSFEDFITEVRAINENYHYIPTVLSANDKSAYIHSATELYLQYYKEDPATYNSKMEELNEEYGIYTNTNATFEDAMEDYRTLYESYTGISLPIYDPFSLFYTVHVPQGN